MQGKLNRGRSSRRLRRVWLYCAVIRYISFFGNACTKSWSLRFSQFSGCWLILSVYILMSFDFPLLGTGISKETDISDNCTVQQWATTWFITLSWREVPISISLSRVFFFTRSSVILLLPLFTIYFTVSQSEFRM
jgi:hypothetical protein